jgi:hypothetical protein
MEKSFKLYLRNTLILEHKHVDALSKESEEVMRLLGKIVTSYQTSSQ